MTNAEIIFALYKSGLIKDPTKLPPGKTLEDLILIFQQIHGLTPDGDVGQVTERALERPRFCVNPDRLILDAKDKCRWDHTEWDGSKWKSGSPKAMLLTYFVEAALPGLSKPETDAAFAEALSYWAEVCAVAFSPSADPTKANLYFEVKLIDGGSSTLAWQELPCGPDTPAKQLKGRYDTGEPWVASADPPASKIDAVRVICHESGHGLGLDHGPEGNLLAPYYDRSIRKPQEWDIAEARLRYGPPVPVVAPPTPPGTPPTTPPAPGKVRVSIVIPGGATYQGDVPKLSK